MPPHLGSISQREMPWNPQALIFRTPWHSLLTPITICIISLPTLEKQRQYPRVEASETALEANFLSDSLLSSSVPAPFVTQVTEMRDSFLQNRR